MPPAQAQFQRERQFPVLPSADTAGDRHQGIWAEEAGPVEPQDRRPVGHAAAHGWPVAAARAMRIIALEKGLTLPAVNSPAASAQP